MLGLLQYSLKPFWGRVPHLGVLAGPSNAGKEHGDPWHVSQRGVFLPFVCGSTGMHARP